jgi:hypothetical protein
MRQVHADQGLPQSVSMKLPDFFDKVPRLRVHDPLAEALGCAELGIFEYSYADAVRLAGHSCPTVAASYWLTWLALEHLYPDDLPQRGGVKVEFRESEREGSTGVAAAIVQMLTGAAGDLGFKGVGGRFARVGLQRFGRDVPLSIRSTRLDNGAAVDAAADLTLPLPGPALRPRTRGHESADLAAIAELGAQWQRRVKHMLIDHPRDPGVFIIREAERRCDPRNLRLPTIRVADQPVPLKNPSGLLVRATDTM